MIFQNELIYTGTKKMISKKTQKEYSVVNFLDSDGIQFSAIAECNIPHGIEQLQKVRATFDLKVGRYMNLSVGNIEVL